MIIILIEPVFQHYDISTDSSRPVNYHLQDDDSFSLHTPSTAKATRSFSEIDFTSLPNSYDHNLISGIPDPLTSQMNSDCPSLYIYSSIDRTSRRNSLQSLKRTVILDYHDF